MLVLTFWVDFLVLTTTRCHISTVKIKIIEGIFEQLSKKNHPTSLKMAAMEAELSECLMRER
jgi:hypothetical protein